MSAGATVMLAPGDRLFRQTLLGAAAGRALGSGHVASGDQRRAPPR